MIRLWRRIKYGDTNKQPKYIIKKDKFNKESLKVLKSRYHVFNQVKLLDY